MRTLISALATLATLAASPVALFPAEAGDAKILVFGGSSGIRALTPEGFAKANGFWLVRKSEAMEIVRALEILKADGDTSLSYSVVNAVLNTESESQRLRRLADEAEKREKERAIALSVLETWKKRAADLRD